MLFPHTILIVLQLELNVDTWWHLCPSALEFHVN